MFVIASACFFDEYVFEVQIDFVIDTCASECVNGGESIAPRVCKCPKGYHEMSCENSN